MNNLQIYKILKHDPKVQEANFLGVFPINLIPLAAMDYPCCLIVNDKPHTHPGGHWIAIFKTADNKGFYFDSYGYPPSNMKEVATVLSTCETWEFNQTPLQTPYSAVCGQYCIFFLTHMAKGYTMANISYLLNDCGDTFSNDAFIFNYIREKYSVFESIKSLDVVDFPFMFQQISSQYE